MSRCVLFPPDGYEKNGLSGDALIEWISRKRMAAKKKHRARKRKMRKMRKSRYLQIGEKRQSCGKRTTEYRNGDYLKKIDDEIEDSEKSVITVEDSDCGNKLRDLIDNWDPPKLQIVNFNDFDDMGWLFEMKQSKKIKANGSASFHGGFSLWQCAQYLPDVDTYALPYTVIF